MEVEEWLHSLPLAPASKAKLCVMAVLYNHAIRHESLTLQKAIGDAVKYLLAKELFW
jgi:hypothetical protein